MNLPYPQQHNNPVHLIPGDQHDTSSSSVSKLSRSPQANLNKCRTLTIDNTNVSYAHESSRASLPTDQYWDALETIEISRSVQNKTVSRLLRHEAEIVRERTIDMNERIQAKEAKKRRKLFSHHHFDVNISHDEDFDDHTYHEEKMSLSRQTFRMKRISILLKHANSLQREILEELHNCAVEHDMYDLPKSPS